MAIMGSSGYEIPAGKKPSRDELIEHVECLVAEIERLQAERDEWKKRCMDLIHHNIEKPEIINGP